MLSILKFRTDDKSSSEIAFQIRKQVFVEEQKVSAEEEFDEFEDESNHYLALMGKEPIGTARWRNTIDGIKLERFAILPEHRGAGAGYFLIKSVLDEVLKFDKLIYLHAQLRAVPLYERAGFVKVGGIFHECEIAHYKMKLNKEPIKMLPVMKPITMVEEFHTAFGIKNEISPIGAISVSDYQLRHRLMQEENDEYLEACKKGDLVEIADALGDKLYILCGTILKHGLQYKIEEIFNEIHSSNMSKLDENGKPIVREDGKILKSNKYFKPDISAILNKKI